MKNNNGVAFVCPYHGWVYSVDANWKIALGNYLECYHCETAHRLYSRMHSFKSLEYEVADLNRAMWARSAAATGIAGLEKPVYRIFREAPGFGGLRVHQSLCVVSRLQDG